jgi:signal transduction histidine kinase
VDQVLQFAATTRGKPWQPLLELQVSQIVEHALRSTNDLLQEAGFVIDRQIDTGLPPVMGDLSVLSQCLQNLVTNAIKYSAGHRWVGVTAKMNEVAEEVQISVQDRGVGIHGADLAKVFNPFYRSPQAVAARVHGAGLGLSIAKRGVEIFGGRLTVLTEVGVGSTFTMHLPVSNKGRKVPNQSTELGAIA